MQGPSSVLLVVNEEAHLRELLRVADLLRTTSDLRPVFYVEDRMKPFGVHTKLVGGDVETLTSDAFAQGDGLAALGGVKGWRRWTCNVVTLIQALASRLPRQGGRMFRFFCNVGAARDQLLRRAAVIRAVLSQRTYQAVVLCEDNVDLDTAIWIVVARRLGIRSIIVPYTIANTVEFAEAFVYANPYQVGTSLPNRLAAWLFPKWVLQFKGRKFLRISYAKIMAMELLGLTPPNPWLLNSGYVDAIAVESRAMEDYYRAAGIPATQLVMTGTLADDAMAAADKDASQRRQALLESFGLPADRPLLLCALPPDQNTFDRPDCEFSDFDDLAGFWAECLAAVAGWNVIVRPHPKTPFDRLNALRRHGLAVTDIDTAHLVPLCDLYVASISATIRWAIACGKPVLNYDVYQYGFEDYAGVEGVALVNTREEFRRLLAQLTSDDRKRASLARAQQRDASRWGCLDGKAGRRLLALLRDEPPATFVGSPSSA